MERLRVQLLAPSPNGVGQREVEILGDFKRLGLKGHRIHMHVSDRPQNAWIPRIHNYSKGFFLDQRYWRLEAVALMLVNCVILK